MSLKKAAEELLKVADAIELEAAEVTKFVCEECSHTATLASINSKRTAAANEVGKNVTVGSITVEDKVGCPACEGTMAYKATDESAKFYFESKKADDDEDKKEDEDEEAAKEASEPIDYDSLERYAASK